MISGGIKFVINYLKSFHSRKYCRKKNSKKLESFSVSRNKSTFKKTPLKLLNLVSKISKYLRVKLAIEITK